MLVPDLENEYLCMENGMLKTAFRVNMLRAGYSGAEINDMLNLINKQAKEKVNYDPSKNE